MRMPKPFNPRDSYARQAQAQGLRARSAFKLEHILKQFPLIKPGHTVLDLGAAPGSWLQVISKRIGAGGLAIGVDLAPIAPIAGNVKTVQCDIFDAACIAQLLPYGLFDVIVSDLAPKTSGIKTRDQAQSSALVERAFELAEQLLKPKGSLVVKLFQGPDTNALRERAQRMFKKVSMLKPPASRDRSFEVYLIGIGKR